MNLEMNQADKAIRQQISKRNFSIFTMEGSFYQIGLSFIDMNAVIPVFIEALTGSIGLSGLAATMKPACSLLVQLFFGPYVRSLGNLPSFIGKAMIIGRSAMLPIIPILLMRIDHKITAVIFFLLFATFWGNHGVIRIPWMDIFGRTIDRRDRGRVFGYQLMFGGIGGALGGLIVKIVLNSERLAFPVKYSILFGLSGIFLVCSGIFILYSKDVAREINKQKVNIVKYFKSLPKCLLLNREYRRFAFFQVFTSFSLMILPFCVLFAKKSFLLGKDAITTLVYMQILGAIFGGILWGQIHKRFGSRTTIQTALGIEIFICLLALFTVFVNNYIPHTPFIIVIVILAGVSSGDWIGVSNYFIDIIDEQERPIYFGLNGIVTLPLTFLSYIGGMIAQNFNFSVLFIIAGLGLLTGFVYSFRLKRV